VANVIRYNTNNNNNLRLIIQTDRMHNHRFTVWTDDHKPLVSVDRKTHRSRIWMHNSHAGRPSRYTPHL